MSYVSYASALKSLMYGMVCTCPDISDVVSVVSRYIVCSRKVHPMNIYGWMGNGAMVLWVP